MMGRPDFGLKFLFVYLPVSLSVHVLAFELRALHLLCRHSLPPVPHLQL
jgi:hypothetical protein